MKINLTISYTVKVILLVVKLLEDFGEDGVIFSEIRILTGKVQRIFPRQCRLETRLGERTDAIDRVVRKHRHSLVSNIKLILARFASVAGIHKSHFSRLIENYVLTVVLVPKNVSADDHGFRPTRCRLSDATADDRFAELCPSDCLSYRYVRVGEDYLFQFLF